MGEGIEGRNSVISCRIQDALVLLLLLQGTLRIRREVGLSSLVAELGPDQAPGAGCVGVPSDLWPTPLIQPCRARGVGLGSAGSSAAKASGCWLSS